MSQTNQKEVKEENIVKKTCRELDFTQKELALMLDVSTGTISMWQKGEITKMGQLALKLLLENRELKNKLQKIKEAQDIITSLSV